MTGFMSKKKLSQKINKEGKSSAPLCGDGTLPSVPWLISTNDGLSLLVHAQPGAKRDSIVGEYNGRLKLSLNAPPVDGKANAKLCSFLAERLGVPKNAVRLVSGETNRAKRFSISGIDAAAALSALQPDA